VSISFLIAVALPSIEDRDNPFCHYASSPTNVP
jgi:hypothetical protein